MKWKADWWGITIIAENKLDSIILEALHKRLPKEIDRISLDYYEDGILEKEGIKEGHKYTELVFHR